MVVLHALMSTTHPRARRNHFHHRLNTLSQAPVCMRMASSNEGDCVSTRAIYLKRCLSWFMALPINGIGCMNNKTLLPLFPIQVVHVGEHRLQVNTAALAQQLHRLLVGHLVAPEKVTHASLLAVKGVVLWLAVLAAGVVYDKGRHSVHGLMHVWHVEKVIRAVNQLLMRVVDGDERGWPKQRTSCDTLLIHSGCLSST